MSPSKIKSMLWRLGHFNNPACPTGVKESELDSLSLSSDEVRTAIKSYQEFMAADFDRLANKHHGRIGIADGDASGPATKELFEVERCGHPDYPPEGMPATGTGSWPAGCHDDYPDNHAYAIRFANSPPSYLGSLDDPNSVIRQALRLAYAAAADMGLVVFEKTGRVNSVNSWTRGRGWIGLAQKPSRFSCGDEIWAKFDNRYRPSKLVEQWAKLLEHEWGHNWGMGHSRGGIMNPSITSAPFTTTAWRGDPSESIMRRYFGGEPVDIGGPDDPDDPPPPDTPNELVFRGEFEAMLGGKSLGKYILTPKPEV